MSVCLTFGCSGQDAFYLANLLTRHNMQQVGISRSIGEWIQGDIADFHFVSGIIKQYQPAYIFHFAANSTTAHSSIYENHAAISTGTLNILESARLHSPRSRIFLSGSAVQFKNTGKPINEETLFAPSSPYAVARICSTYAGRYFRETFGLKVYIGFLFNHDSPLRTERHVNQKIAATAKRIARGSRERLVLGDPFVEKEFNFAGDIVKAMWLLVNQDNIYEAVLGSGKTHTIAEWAEACFNKMGLDLQDYLQIDYNYTAEYKRLVCNPQRIMSLGWSPRVTFQQLVNMMLENYDCRM
jgi:GDPmannose 4,6-dehydratase